MPYYYNDAKSLFKSTSFSRGIMITFNSQWYKVQILKANNINCFCYFWKSKLKSDPKSRGCKCCWDIVQIIILDWFYNIEVRYGCRV